MRLYLSGPITGHTDWRQTFDAAAAALRAAGYEVTSPSDQDPASDDALTWEQHLRRDIKALMDCDGVALLGGWGGSRGARLEAAVARGLRMPSRYVDWWLSGAEKRRVACAEGAR